MKRVFFSLILTGCFYATASYGSPLSRPVHLFIVRSALVQNFFSTLGQGWATKMKIRIHKEVLHGQFGDVEEVYVPVIDDGTDRLTTFEKEFPETQSHLQAIALRSPGSYLIWDTTDKTIGTFRLDIPNTEASKSPYARDEVDAAVVNSQILFSAARESQSLAVLPVVFGETLKDGPLQYSYLLRPFSPSGSNLAAIHPLSELLDSNIDTEWRTQYLELFAREMATLNYKYGIYPSLSPQALDLELDLKTNRIRKFILRGSKNIAVDNFMRLALKEAPLHTGKRTPQINRFHYYDPGLAQPGENIATFSSRSIAIPGLSKMTALRVFLKSYIKTVREVTGVATDPNERRPAMESRWNENEIRGFLSGSLQSIYNQVVAAKRPQFNDTPQGAQGLLQSEFKRRYDSSDVALVDYSHPTTLGFHNLDLAWGLFTHRLNFTFDKNLTSIFAFDVKTGKVLAIAYDVKQESRFTKVGTLDSSSPFGDFLERAILGFKLVTN